MGRKLYIGVIWFFSGDGSRLLTGGLERWCRDFATSARRRGFEVEIVQKATECFERELELGITVKGVPAAMGFRGNWALSRWFRRYVRNGDPVVFISQELCVGHPPERNACVNHGIWWDGDMPWPKRFLNKRLQRGILSKTRGVICVDTNYINWCHAELSNRAAWQHKLHYVPNYADTELFRVSSRGKPPDRVRILFPRRVSGNTLSEQGRGAGLLLSAALILRKIGFDFELIFAGRGNLQDALVQWGYDNGLSERIRVMDVGLDEMPKVYAECDIVVVPSLEHEGTSLSAIEGMCSGLPTVVSHIGGLCNVVVDGLTGFVCDLTPESLADAIVRAASLGRAPQDSSILNRVRQALSKDRWERQVWECLERSLDLR